MVMKTCGNCFLVESMKSLDILGIPPQKDGGCAEVERK